jgi:hypothetical protein
VRTRVLKVVEYIGDSEWIAMVLARSLVTPFHTGSNKIRSAVVPVGSVCVSLSEAVACLAAAGRAAGADATPPASPATGFSGAGACPGPAQAEDGAQGQLGASTAGLPCLCGAPLPAATERTGPTVGTRYFHECPSCGRGWAATEAGPWELSRGIDRADLRSGR